MESKKILSSFLGRKISSWLSNDFKAKFEQIKAEPTQQQEPDQPKEISQPQISPAQATEEPLLQQKATEQANQQNPHDHPSFKRQRSPKNPPWQEKVPPDEIKVDLEPKANYYANQHPTVNRYDLPAAQIEKRNQIYRYEIDQKNNGKRGLKPIK